mgnify:CR=1 FL=1
MSVFSEPGLKDFAERLDDLRDLHSLVESSIEEEPPISIREGGIIKDGYNSEVDQLRLFYRFT